MATQKANSNLHKAKNAKKDEFYTQLLDIENELKHYHHHFKNNVVYCNGGKTELSNGQMLCQECNRSKGGK